MSIVGILFFLLTAGCVGGASSPPREPPVTGAAHGEGAKTPAKVSALPASPEQPPKKESPAPGPGKQGAAPPPLDLVSLEQRLRDTKAIGLLTKISLKNQVDDLLTQFRAFHEGRAGAALTELRERYNLLLLKVLSLLQGNDPALAQAVAASREAIWGLLADPAKFATL